MIESSFEPLTLVFSFLCFYEEAIWLNFWLESTGCIRSGDSATKRLFELSCSFVVTGDCISVCKCFGEPSDVATLEMTIEEFLSFFEISKLSSLISSGYLSTSLTEISLFVCITTWRPS